MTPETNPDTDIIQTLGIDKSSRHRRHLKRWLVVVFFLAAAVTASLLVWKRTQASSTTTFKTQEAKRGDIIVTVTATGTLQPRNQVVVGSELSGSVESVEVDYNSRVKVGQALARLDTSKLQAQVLQAKAALESAQAKVLQAGATVKESRNNLDRLQRVQVLSNGKVPSQNDMEAAEAALDRALANETGAKADVSQAQANLQTKEMDLGKAVIRSPINGIVLARNVDPGQTVAASLQAPVLFTLAEDLRQMELHVDVDEADVGQVQERQEARFTVDAYPNRAFAARISQVRYGAKTASGVVTYETVLSLDNSDLSLRPGMTATADITVKKVQNAIVVPNAALRFTPPQGKEKSVSPNQGQGGLVGSLLPQRPRRPASSMQRQGAKGGGGMRKQQRVWTLTNGEPLAIPVTIGVTDGVVTEITGGEVSPGMALVVDSAGGGR
ncbi:MAG: efflux RND transporter periplasmic adaptor subunit [Desulfobacterales bacterium]|nr:efflux RND transporter periplasmic adaptor subunit [Desulfobacterales bacterium]